MTLNSLTIAAARDALRAKEITAVELTETCLAAIDGAGALNAFVHHTPDLALQHLIRIGRLSSVAYFHLPLQSTSKGSSPVLS